MSALCIRWYRHRTTARVSHAHALDSSGRQFDISVAHLAYVATRASTLSCAMVAARILQSLALAIVNG